MFTIFPWLYVILSCFKQPPLNFTLVLVPKWFNEGSRKLLAVEEVLILSSHNRLDFHSKTKSELTILLKYLCIGWNTQ